MVLIPSQCLQYATAAGQLNDTEGYILIHRTVVIQVKFEQHIGPSEVTFCGVMLLRRQRQVNILVFL